MGKILHKEVSPSNRWGARAACGQHNKSPYWNGAIQWNRVTCKRCLTKHPDNVVGKDESMKQKKSETFYLISALLPDSLPAGQLQRHPTEKGAIDTAKSIMESRSRKGQPEIEFYILKVTHKLSRELLPVNVRKL